MSFFFWKNQTCFLGHAPCKKGRAFLKEFLILRKKIQKNIWATKGERENDKMREQRNERTTK